MPAGFTQWLVIRPEVTWGVYNGSGTDIPIRVSGDSAFTPIAVPGRYELPSADGGNRMVQNVSSRITVAGTLTTPLYPVQIATLLDWATNQTVTNFVGDLRSYSITYYDSVELVRVLGAKVENLTAAFASETNEGMAMLALTLAGQQFVNTSVTPITQAQPAFNTYPTAKPYVIQESALTFGASRAAYKSFTFTIANKLAKTFEQGTYINNCTYCGREVTGSIDFPYVTGTTAYDRTAYEAQTAQTASIVFTKASPAHALTLDFKSTAFSTQRQRTVPLGDIGRQSFDFKAFYDATAGTDFSSAET